MGLSTVRLGANMSQQALIAAINQNFQLLENLNRTQVFKDENGINRIILGRWPDGTYGLIISKPNQDVLELFA